MPSIYLYQSSPYTGYFKYYNVKKQDYDKCKLFVKYDHRPQSKITHEDFWAYKDYSIRYGQYVTIKKSSKYKDYHYAEVYFNKYYKNNFLILVLYFKGEKGIYYTNTDYKNHFSGSRETTINSLKSFNSFHIDNELIDALVEENDKINDTITFQIDKKDAMYNLRVNTSHKTYQFYTLYTHKPNSIHRNKKCFILNNKRVLMTKVYGEKLVVLEDVQNKQYNELDVYHTDRGGIPFIVKLKSINVCYKYIQDKKLGDHWEKIHQLHDNDIQAHLYKIKDDKENSLTYILENKASYGNVMVNKHSHESGFTKYHHNPIVTERPKTNVNLNHNPFTTETGKYDKNLYDLTAYFLKYKDKEDQSPFLVAFKEKLKEQGQMNYYSVGSDRLSWRKLNVKGPSEVDLKLKELWAKGSTLTSLEELKDEIPKIFPAISIEETTKNTTTNDTQVTQINPDQQPSEQVGTIAGSVAGTLSVVGISGGVIYKFWGPISTFFNPLM